MLQGNAEVNRSWVISPRNRLRSRLRKSKPKTVPISRRRRMSRHPSKCQRSSTLRQTRPVGAISSATTENHAVESLSAWFSFCITLLPAESINPASAPVNLDLSGFLQLGDISGRAVLFAAGQDDGKYYDTCRLEIPGRQNASG